MTTLRAILAALLICSAPLHAQTLKSLMFNSTNGQVVANTATLTFTNAINFSNAAATRTNLGLGSTNTVQFGQVDAQTFYVDEGGGGIQFNGEPVKAVTRTNLGITLSALTNTNNANFRAAIELGGFWSEEGWANLYDSSTNLVLSVEDGVEIYRDLRFGGTNATSNAAITRTNLGLGATNIVTFAGLTNNGDITINQTATNNGLLYIRRTNNEPFLGLANLIASNNTTISNETLFRVGVSEATNKAAQFGFRSTNTNGNGVAVFSVFGYNALMMIGPSDPTAGTNPIQATVYSIAPTNKVMTLITTNTGAMQMHRPIGIDTAGVSTNAPANTTNVAGWIQFYVGTNSVRVPYYQ